MRDFLYSSQPSRVLFGSGALARLSEELERLGLERVLLLSTPGQEALARRIAAQIAPLCAGVFAGAVMHTPVDVTERAMLHVEALGSDGLVAIGGGSAIGLGKAIALRTDLAQIAIPTTYAGSEMTPILGETKDGTKVTRTSPKILPEVVIYDVDLTLRLPPPISGTSGINAVAHAVEALYAKDRNPVTSMMALEAIRVLARALPAIVADPMNREARSDALYGAWLCGTCLGAVGMALHHKLCHTLGGTFDLPHASTHSIVLPHALAYNAPAIPDEFKLLGEVLGYPDPARALYELVGAVGAPRALRDIGMPADGIDEAVDRALANPYWNPRPLERDALRACIARAWAGEPPQRD